MSARQRIQKGFTLVEILIVVVILGILAAIVIPQFTNASETAKASSLTSQLQSIRSQLELFQVQHNGKYPAADTLWDQLTKKTNMDGDVDEDGTFGPYLKKAPVNPFTNGSAVGTDWDYNEETGEIRAILPDGIDYATLGIPANDVKGEEEDEV